MNTSPPQPGESRSISHWLADAASNMWVIGTQLEFRHQLVHRYAANTATKNMSRDAHWNIVCQTGSCKNQKQHAVGCEHIHIELNSCQLTVEWTAGVGWTQHDQFIAPLNTLPPRSTKAFGWTVCDIQHHDVLSCGTVVDKFPDTHPGEWM